MEVSIVTKDGANYSVTADIVDCRKEFVQSNAAADQKGKRIIYVNPDLFAMVTIDQGQGEVGADGDR